MILLFASESSLTLAEDNQKVISIGDLPSGAEKTVSWKVTAPWPEESGPAVYSVIADIDNQTATLLKENYIYLLSKMKTITRLILKSINGISRTTLHTLQIIK